MILDKFIMMQTIVIVVEKIIKTMTRRINQKTWNIFQNEDNINDDLNNYYFINNIYDSNKYNNS